MRRIKSFVPSVTLQTIYKTLVLPYFDYCSPLWDNCGKVLQDKLQKFQNRAAGIITGASYDVRSADVLDTLDHTAPNLKDLFRKKYETHQNAFNL